MFSYLFCWSWKLDIMCFLMEVFPIRISHPNLAGYLLYHTSIKVFLNEVCRISGEDCWRVLNGSVHARYFGFFVHKIFDPPLLCAHGHSLAGKFYLRICGRGNECIMVSVQGRSSEAIDRNLISCMVVPLWPYPGQVRVSWSLGQRYSVENANFATWVLFVLNAIRFSQIFFTLIADQKLNLMLS